MGKSVYDIFEIEPLPIVDDDEKLRKKIDEYFHEIRRSISDVEDATVHRNLTGAVRDCQNLVDNLLSVYSDRNETMKCLARDAEDLREALDMVLGMIPLHAIIPIPTCDRPAKHYEQWLVENAVSDYQYINIDNGAIVIFTSDADHTLFKIRFGV